MERYGESRLLRNQSDRVEFKLRGNSIPNDMEATQTSTLPESFRIVRETKMGIHKLNEVFIGLQHSPALRRVLKTQKLLDQFLNNATVTVANIPGYMFVDPSSGSVVISRKYLLDEEVSVLYLDIVHELIHVKQWHEGRNLFDESYRYGDRPTELEAYSVVVEEARRIGKQEKEIAEYLAVPWISKRELQKLLEKMGVKAV